MSRTDTSGQVLPPDASASLKRRASPLFEGMDHGAGRKRIKEDTEQEAHNLDSRQDDYVDGGKLADELEQELQCGCCSALVHRPVIVSPCQHFFCGRLAAAP